MTGLKLLAATALISTIPATSVLAQEPAAFLAQFPDRDILNGGALTPAGRILALPGGLPVIMRQTKLMRDWAAPVPHPGPRAITGAFHDGRRYSPR